MAAKTKYCSILCCHNNSEKNIEKHFFRIPDNKEVRRKWFDSIAITEMTKTKLYVCEDHFNLKEDCANFMFYKTIGKLLKLKRGVVPHKNLQQIDSVATNSQITSSERKRKLAIVEEYENKKRNIQKKLMSCSTTPEKIFCMTCNIAVTTCVTTCTSSKILGPNIKPVLSDATTNTVSRWRGNIVRMLSTLSGVVPNETNRDEFNTSETNMNQEFNKQFEFINCDSVSTNENNVDSNNKTVLNKHSDINYSLNFDRIKEEMIEQENCLTQELIQRNSLLNNFEMKSEEQKVEEMLEDNITIKDEFIEFEDSADQDIKINTKDELDDSFKCSKKQQAQEMLQDDITIKEEYIEFEDSVDTKNVLHDSVLKFNIKDEANDSSILSEKQQIKEILVDNITVKEESIDTVD